MQMFWKLSISCGRGMAGIFVVIGLLALVVYAMAKVGNK